MPKTTYYRGTFLCHCSVSPLHPIALQAAQEFHIKHAEQGPAAFVTFRDAAAVFHQASADLLRTSAENIAFITSTGTGLSCIANGYPFQAGDRIITYSHEYGSNYYPWLIASQRFGVELDLLPDIDPSGDLPEGGPRGWSIEDLDSLITKRTKLVALSHVQFISGFAADLRAVADLCRSRGVDLVIDAAQSLGCLPIYPEELGIAAVAASGWKWLMGPQGAGVFYTAPEFRDKLAHVMGGALMVEDWLNFTDLTWRPYSDARRFEYSTVPRAYVHALGQVIKQVFLPLGIEDIADRVLQHRAQICSTIDPKKYQAIEFPEPHRSGIVVVQPRNAEPKQLLEKLRKEGLHLVSHGPYLRFAPHFYNTKEEIAWAVELLNTIE